MGKYGQAALTIAGYAIGSYFGYPQLGAVVGSLAGGLLFPPQLPTIGPPRLSDFGSTGSSVGVGIPRGHGLFPADCQVIWKSDLREVIVSEEVGGKGGPTQTVETPTYYQDFAVGLSEGEDPITLQEPIAGIRRIWANGKVIYDRRPQQPGESDTDFNVRIAASNVLDTQMVVYLGTEDQEPDPTMEAALGVDEVSGYRGLAYIVFINWQNKAEDGNRMPQSMRVECYTAGAVAEASVFEYSNAFLPPWNAGAEIPLYSVYNGMAVDYDFTVEATGRSFGSRRGRVSGHFDSLSVALNRAELQAQRTADYFLGYSLTPFSGAMSARGVTNRMDTRRQVSTYDAYSINLHFNPINTTVAKRSGTSLAKLMSLGMAPGVPVHSNGYFLNMGIFSPSSAGVYQWWASDYRSGAAYDRSTTLIDWAITTGRSSNPGAVLVTGDTIINVQRLLMPPGDQCAVTVPSLPGYCISTRGNLIRQQSWTYVEAGTFTKAHVLQRLATTDQQISGESINHRVRVVSKYPLNPALPFGHANYSNQAFWESAYAQAVAAGQMAAGLTFGVHYPVDEDFYYRRPLTQATITTNRIQVADVVASIMRESNYTAGDFDTASIDSTTIGYVRTRVMTGRSAIEPLRQAYFFDGIESNGMAKFVKRGRGIVATITEDELGVAAFGEEAPSRLTTTTTDETTLPRLVRVHYLALARDYEPGEQPSPPRLDTKATNDIDVELPIVLDDDEAAQIAEVLWANAWSERRGHELVLDFGRQELEPTDPVNIPVDGIYRRVRITSITDAFPISRRLSVVRDDDGSYISYAVGTTSSFVPSVLTIPSPAELILLDLPPLRDEDDDAGIYAAARPYLADATFRGAIVLRSADGGASYAQIGTLGSAVPVGVVLQPLPASEPWIWDEANTLYVQMQHGELESRTEDAVLAGANAAAIGAHGRWLIVQFRDASYVGDGIWELTGLLQGRRGTEHNMGTVLAGDRFVMISVGGLGRLAMNTTEIGAERLYKAVAVGTNAADAAVQAFTGAGEALKPFSPVYLQLHRQDDGDLVLTWLRRGRFGQTLQSGTDVPLSEETEAYEVDILTDGVVVRTIEATEESITYSAALQATDYGSPTPDLLTFNVYQISATVGRGHAGTLSTSLADIEAEPGEGEETPEEIADTDADAIIVPLTYDEVNEAVAPLTWTRLGDGPRITAAGMLGDGYQARLRANASLPAYATSNSGPLYLRATIAPFAGAKNATRDVVVAVCVDDATANPRLAFAVVDDPTASNEPMVACRSFTGSTQSQRLCRKDWRFAFAYPEKAVGSDAALPQSVCLFDDAVFVGAHYNNNFCRVHKCDPLSGELMGFFQMGVADTHMGGMSVRPSDGTFWVNESNIYQVDVDASLLSQSMVATLTYAVDGAPNLGSTQWVEVEEVEYLLITEWVSSGTGYLYLLAASEVVDGGAFTVGDEIKKLVLPLQVQGVAYKDGLLYMGCSNTPSGGLIRVMDFDAWVADGTDGESWATYDAGVSYIPPTEQLEDLDFDEAGNLWTVTEGESSAGDDAAFLAAWYSPLTGPVANTFSAYYNGAGSVEIRINDKHFATKAWTPTPTPGAISIGGPPQASAGTNNGFFVGTVRDVIIQGSDYNPEDFEGILIYEADGNVSELPFVIENADAETGDTSGWTNEVGALEVRTGGPPPYEGTYYFFGGANVHTKARQRLDLLDQTGLTADIIDAGTCWVIARWWAAVFDVQTDTNAVGFRFLDESQVQIAENLSPAFAPSPGDVWIPRSYGLLVPATTRYVDIVIDLNRLDGANCDGDVDLITAALYLPEENE